MARPATTYLDLAEEQIRAGQLQAARSILRDGRPKSPPRATLARLANLARRCGWPELAVRALARYVRPSDGKKIERATPAESAEYGAALSVLGANVEAIAILAKVDPAAYAAAPLLLAFAHIAEWDYAAAIPLLQRFVATADPYQGRVARVNLAAAYVHEGRTGESDGLIRALLDEVRAEASGNRLLEANLLQLLAHQQIRTERYGDARASLDAATTLTAGSESVFSLIIAKWAAVLELRARPSAAALERLRGVRADAIRRSFWEPARDCDFHEAAHSRSAEIFARLHFGTPYEAYRCWLAAELERRAIAPAGEFPPATYRHALGAARGESPPTLRLLTGEGPTPGASLKPGQLVHRLLTALLSDLYRPQRIVSLYALAFAGQHFNPISSPKVTREGIRRLRAHFTDARLALRVRFEKGFYSLQSPSAFEVLIEARAPAGVVPSSRDPKVRAMLRQLTRKFGAREFLTGEAAAALGIPLRTVRRHLSEARSQGKVDVLGPPHQPRYRLRPQV